MLFHIVDAGTWTRARREGRYEPASLDDVGFVHLSCADQVLLAAQSHYRGVVGLVVLCIDEGALDRGAVVFEAGSAPNQHLVFPHLYGPLPVDAVVDVVGLPCRPDGRFDPPDLPDAGS